MTTVFQPAFWRLHMGVWILSGRIWIQSTDNIAVLWHAGQCQFKGPSNSSRVPRLGCQGSQRSGECMNIGSHLSNRSVWKGNVAFFCYDWAQTPPVNLAIRSLLFLIRSNLAQDGLDTLPPSSALWLFPSSQTCNTKGAPTSTLDVSNLDTWTHLTPFYIIVS